MNPVVLHHLLDLHATEVLHLCVDILSNTFQVLAVRSSTVLATKVTKKPNTGFETFLKCVVELDKLRAKHNHWMQVFTDFLDKVSVSSSWKIKCISDSIILSRIDLVTITIEEIPQRRPIQT